MAKSRSVDDLNSLDQIYELMANNDQWVKEGKVVNQVTIWMSSRLYTFRIIDFIFA